MGGTSAQMLACASRGVHALAEFLKNVYFIVIFADQVIPTFGMFVCGPVWLMFVLYVFWGRRSFIDPICCNFCIVLSMFLRFGFCPILHFLCETSTCHLDSCPPEDKWYGVILCRGVESSRLRFKPECANVFH